MENEIFEVTADGKHLKFKVFEGPFPAQINMKEVMAKRAAGVSIREIADDCGVSYSTIWHRVDRLKK